MYGAKIVDGRMSEADMMAPTGSSPRASLCLSESPCSNGGFAPNVSQNGHAHRDGSHADSAQNGLSLEDKPREPSLDSSGCLPDQAPPLLNGHVHSGLANGNGACYLPWAFLHRSLGLARCLSHCHITSWKPMGVPETDGCSLAYRTAVAAELAHRK